MNTDHLQSTLDKTEMLVVKEITAKLEIYCVSHLESRPQPHECRRRRRERPSVTFGPNPCQNGRD